MTENPETPLNKGTEFILGGGGWRDKAKNWLKDNSSIILAVAVIIILGGSIYAYTQTNHSLLLQHTPDSQATNQPKETLNQKNATQVDTQKQNNHKINNKASKQQNTGQDKLNVTGDKSHIVTPNDSFIETAKKGEGITHLARRALKQYLQETGKDKELTKEHKIYIEDYLQNKTGAESLKVDETRSFSKILIKQAIQHSKQLTQKQLTQITPYANLVTNL